jgi:hypothetical protein
MRAREETAQRHGVGVKPKRRYDSIARGNGFGIGAAERRGARVVRSYRHSCFGYFRCNSDLIFG